MGSLGFALGGAIGGAGAGLAEVGRQQTQALIQQKLEQMRQDYQSSLQQKGFEHQETMLGKEQTFQKSLKEEELQATAAYKGAERQQREKLAGEHEKGATERSHIAANARVDAAALNFSRGSRTGAGQGSKPFQSQKAGDYIDPKNPALGVVQHDVTFDPNTGTYYAQVGDRTFYADRSGNPVDKFGNVVNPTATRRAPAAAVNQFLQDAQKDPTAAAAFHSDYGYLPNGYLAQLQRSRVSNTSSQTQSIKLPSGRVFNPPAGAGGGGPETPEAPEAPEQSEGAYQDPIPGE